MSAETPSHAPTAHRHPSELRPEVGRIVVVCGDCERRSDGPRHLDAKHARKLLKHALPRGGARVVIGSCLGPCPKKALTVAVAPAGDGLRMAAVDGAHTLVAAVEAMSDAG